MRYQLGEKPFLWLFVFLFLTATNSGAQDSKQKPDDVWQKEAVIQNVIRPSVYIDSGKKTVGSGVLIASIPNKKQNFTNFVLTAHHVMRNSLAEKRDNQGRVYDSTVFVEMRDEDGLNLSKYKAKHIMPKTFNEIVQRSTGRTVSVGHSKKEMTVHKFGKQIDIALITFESKKQIKSVAKIPRAMFLERIGATTDVRLVGYPIGIGPQSTFGELSSLMRLREAVYRLISAEGTVGNSGGGVFTVKGNYLVGIFSKLFITSRYKVPGGLMVRMKNIHKYLILAGYGTLIPGWEAPKKTFDLAFKLP